MRHVSKMSKVFAIALTAVFYLALAVGYPIDDDVNGEGPARQYRMAVEKHLNVVLESKIDTYDAKKVKFYLYTKQQPEKVELKHEEVLQYLKNSSYDPERPTKIIIHDRLFFESFYKELVNAYLRHYRKPVNVITVDYSYYSGAEHKEFMRVYREIGASVAKFIEELSHYRVDGDKIHIIGHGVGAHIAAAAAHKLTVFKVGRITGLDPVGLEFDEDKTLHQLQKRDAHFVDVIIMDTSKIGSNQIERGHVNFHPYEETTQTTQEESDVLMSHLKSYFYYVESISRGKVFQAYAADSYNSFKTGKYDRTKMNWMGEYVSKDVVGQFYLYVKPVPPYGLSTDSHYRFEEAKFNETYISFILGTKLAPFVFMPKDDPYFGKAVINQQTLYNGFGEGPSTEYADEARRYSNELRI